MVKEDFIDGKRILTRHITYQFTYDIMMLPVAQEHIINDQVETLLALDFHQAKDKYIKLKDNLAVNWNLLDLADIPHSYIYKRKKDKLRRY